MKPEKIFIFFRWLRPGKRPEKKQPVREECEFHEHRFPLRDSGNSRMVKRYINKFWAM